MPFPSTFAAFLGNSPVVENLRAAIAAGRLPQSLILAGPQGTGKYTLALLLTLALECEMQPRETGLDGRLLAGFCGQCRHCTRIQDSADLDLRVSEAVTAREEIPKDTDKRETRILVQTHPDVLILPPDPPQLLIKLGQIRTLIARAQRLPVEGPARVFILTASSLMKEAANSLLKVLEEPPPRVHIIMLAENVSELLPTIRSRCAIARLGTLPFSEIEAWLADRRSDWNPRDRALVARLSEGAVGRALGFPLEEYRQARSDAFVLLAGAENAGDFSTLFRTTEGYRAGAEGQAKTAALLRALSRLLEDLVFLQAGAADRIANFDRRRELERFAEQITFHWIENALHSLDQVQSGVRRNLLRSLSLDSLALDLRMADR